MATLNVKVPDGMEADIEAFLAEHPHYLNKSEFVRDAIRHLLAEPKLSDDAVAQVREGRAQAARDEDLVPLDDAVDDAPDDDGGDG